jgi:hypothetical protein
MRDADLLRAIAKRRNDAEFMGHVRRIIADNADILARLGDAPRCDRPPEGWWCSREPGHKGPCAARPHTAVIQGDVGQGQERRSDA